MARGSNPQTGVAAASKRKPKGAGAAGGDGQIAASFGYEGVAPLGALGIGGLGTVALINGQKFRNNWLRLPLAQQMNACRQMAKINEFIGPVVGMRWKCHRAGFTISDQPRATRFFKPIVSDILWEHVVQDNAVLLFKRGEAYPPVTVLDSENVTYENIAGRARIRFRPSTAQASFSMTNDERREYLERLGQKMYDAVFGGQELTVWEDDNEWGFVTQSSGKREAKLQIPGLVPMLDVVDFLTLMGVGDWNLAWYRKDVIRQIKKGYKITQGATAGLDSVNITDDQVIQLGEGFKKVSGNNNIPMNHDVDISYLLMNPEAFDEKQVAGAVRRLLNWGGIEAVALFGNFSQQNGAAPSLMRNARVEAEYRRGVVRDLICQLLDEPEFSGLLDGSDVDTEELVFGWSMTGLYTVEELKTITTTLAGGHASPQTIRELWSLNDKIESARMLKAHDNLDAYIPPFETRQGLIAGRWPDKFPGADKAASGASDPAANPEGGRPADSSQPA